MEWAAPTLTRSPFQDPAMFQTIKYEPSDFSRMPWKNGGGQTTELARGGPRDQYTWRLSLAEIDVDGPFSRFPGMQRLISVIQGKGVHLNLESQSRKVIVPFQTLSFDGDQETNCQLLGGPVQDINLIYSPRHVSPRWEWTRPGYSHGFNTSADTTLLFSPEFQTTITSDRFSPINLPRGHLLEIRNTTEPANFEIKLTGSRCLIIGLTNRGPHNSSTP